jgi:soluble lytic murein transglycosylase-like protein
MPRIPADYDLSGPFNLRSGRTISTYDASAIGRGIKSFASDLASVASDIKQKKEEQTRKNNAVDIARAEAYKTKGLLDVQNQFENDPDFSTFNKRGDPTIDKTLSDAGNLIRDQQMRERWQAEASEQAIRAKDWLRDKATDKRRGAETSALDDANTVNYNLVVDPNTPDAIRDKARADIDGAIEMAEKSGLLTQEEASKRRELFVQKAYDEQAILAAKAGKYDKLPNPANPLNKVSITDDPLTRAMISVESKGQVDAESHKGASGLMQVMPETAAEIAAQLGDTDFPKTLEAQKEYLKNEGVSIRYGQKYMSNMLKKYDGDTEAALIAYNGGPGRADAWLKAGRDDSVIPKESADYYKKVNEALRLSPDDRDEKAGQNLPDQSFNPEQVTAARTYLQSHTDKNADAINGLKEPFAVKLSNLLQSAPPEMRDKLGLFSGFRSVERQNELWQAALKKYGSAAKARKWVAPPGHSQHNEGNAADLAYDGKSLKNAPPEVVKWLHDNAGAHGLKFPLGNENWHIEDSSTRGGKEVKPVNQLLASTQPTVDLPPELAKASPEARMKAYDIAIANRDDAFRRTVADTKAAQQQAKDDLSLQIAVDPARVSQSDILNNQYIDNGDKASLINTLNSALKENQGVDQLISRLGAGDTVSINPFDGDQKKLANKAFDKMLTMVPEEKQAPLTSSFISQTGLIPDSVQADIRRGMVTQDVNQMAQTLQTVDAIAKIAPVSIAAMAGHEQVEKNLTAYRHYSFDMGYSPEEAARKVVSLNDPAMSARRDAIMKSKPIADLIKGVDASTVADIFDTVLSFAPNLGTVPNQQQLSVGYTPEGEQAIVADYKGILEESIADAGGDPVLGKKMADERFAKLYGTSDLTIAGNRSVVKLPPEKTYPADVAGSHDYIRQQALDDLKQEKIDATDVFLQPYDQTERDVSAGRPANYQLFYIQDGQLHKYQHPFTADPAKANETAIQKSSENQKANLKEAVSDDKFYDAIRAARDEAAEKYKDYASPFREQMMREAEQQVRDDAANAVQPDVVTPDLPAGADDIAGTSPAIQQEQASPMRLDRQGLQDEIRKAREAVEEQLKGESRLVRTQAIRKAEREARDRWEKAGGKLNAD